MGTNYYAKRTVPTYVGPYEESLHIGKSSAGWCFGLRVYPELGINSLEDWKKAITEGCWEIYDEYEDEVTLEELLDVITVRSGKIPIKESFELSKQQGLYWSDATYNQILDWTCAEEGPNNLLRHKIGPLCVEHGEGTWDYMIGEFS